VRSSAAEVKKLTIETDPLRDKSFSQDQLAGR
jgi:hypothetical protein